MPRGRQSEKRRETAAESGEDRISDLHDDLLHRVLSFLPAHEAVRTCVLSRRWREVWKSVRVLRFTRAESWGSPARFNRFVNDLLSFRDSAPLEEFELKTYLFMPQITSRAFNDSKESVRYACEWIQYALMRDVQVLRVLVNSRPRPLLLVNEPLISEHLRTLQLESVVLDGSSMDFSRCPALKDLEMRNCQIAAHKISSQSLRRLCINCCDFSDHICTQILAPNLLSLRLDVDSGWDPSLQNMPLLVTAYIRLDRYCKNRCRHSNFEQCYCDTCVQCYGSHDGSDRCLLLGGLSNATNLELAAHSVYNQHPGVNIFKRDMKLGSIFNYLKTLVLDGWVVAREVEALICFLQNAPILEMVILQLYNELKDDVAMEESCSSLETFFPSGHLKIVEISCRKVVENVHKFVKILNTYGITSDLINIRETDS